MLEQNPAPGLCAGIVTSLLVALLGQARVYVTLGRAKLLPAWVARVNSLTGTPVNATLLTAMTAGTLALLFDIDILAELVSIGTLAVFFLVRLHGQQRNMVLTWRCCKSCISGRAAVQGGPSGP